MPQINTTLGELGEIMVGYQIRGKVEPEPDGKCSLIQLRNVQGGTLDLSDVSRMTLPHDKAWSRYLARPGDLLLRSRGANYRAAYVAGVPEDAVVVAPLFRMRPDAGRVLPEYLAWFINREASQTFLHSQHTGTYLPAVGIAGFRSLPVTVPALNVQKQIIEIDALAKRERELMHQRQKARDTQIAALLEQVLKDN